MTRTSYLTLACAVEAEIEVKRSRFLAHLEPVPDEASARAVVDGARRRHHDARHHCSAFVLGVDGSTERSSDDGEPAGTAGAPMLEVLRGAELRDLVAVVTRWFGGTLLGAGGLVRAYSEAVQAGIDRARIVRRELVEEVELVLGHADSGRIESALRARGVVVLEVSHAAEVTLLLGVAPAELPRLDALIAELTGGTAAARRRGHRWADATG